MGSSVAVLGLLTDYPALGGQALRYALAAALLAGAAAARGRGLPSISGRDALQLAALAASGLVAFNLLVLAREGVPLNIIQRQLGHANLGTTSIYLQGIDPEEIIATVRTRRGPMMSASAGLRL